MMVVGRLLYIESREEKKMKRVGEGYKTIEWGRRGKNNKIEDEEDGKQLK